MAVFATRQLHIKNTKSGHIDDCNIYTTVKEAKPVSYNGTAIAGETMTVKHNNVVGYIGLVPKTSTYTTYNTPLVIKKSGVEYYVQTQTVNSYKVVISATSNQKIKFTANGNTTEVTTAAKTVYLNEGTAYTCEIVANTGYTKGSLTGASTSGYITQNMNISATEATKNEFAVEIIVPTGATIVIQKGSSVTPYTKGTHTTSLMYGDVIAISFLSNNSAQYELYNATVNGAAFVSGSSYTMPAEAVTITCETRVKKYTLTMVQGTGTTLSVKCNDEEVPNNSTLDYGTVVTYKTTANTGYENADVTVGG